MGGQTKHGSRIEVVAGFSLKVSKPFFEGSEKRNLGSPKKKKWKVGPQFTEDMWVCGWDLGGFVCSWRGIGGVHFLTASRRTQRGGRGITAS